MVACFIRNHQEGKVPDMVKVHPRSGDELYVSYEEGVYRFGGQVTKTFIAETLI
jgi:diaminopimelate epimerase